MFDNNKANVKESILKIKQTLINNVLDIAEANGEDVDVQLLKVINNMNEETLISNALDFILFNDHYMDQLMEVIKQAMSEENIPF